MTAPAPDITADSVGIVESRQVKLDLPPDGLRLESGGVIPEITVAYEAYGTLRPQKDNVIFICHALTGDAHAAGYHKPPGKATRGWWDDMVGPGKGIDTRHYYVVCANVLGGCKGTTGPESLNPATGRPYGSAFPAVTVGDMVVVHKLLLEKLGITQLAAVVGGSFGGMQSLEMAIRYPDFVKRCICIATTTRLSAQALAFDIVGREAIVTDADYQNGDYYESGRVPAHGLAQARKIGHITYLSPEMMDLRFGREKREPGTGAGTSGFQTNFQVESYLNHKGEGFVRRFDANSYLHITRAMDEFDLGSGEVDVLEKIRSLGSRIMVIALSSDWLFPPEQSMELATHLIRAGKSISYCGLEAPHGHDAFLLDIRYLAEAVTAFLPWISEASSSPAPVVSLPDPERVREYDIVAGMVSPGASVLDIGCGDGELLSWLHSRHNTRGVGVEIDIEKVIAVIDKGHDVIQSDIDRGLAMIPDGSYDFAVLSQTLQVVKRPRFVLNEILRVARQGIVSFPNFGMIWNRLRLLANGRMPSGRALPYAWYDTPNIHLFTYKDFLDICRQDGIRIEAVECIATGWTGRCLSAAGLYSLGADRVIARISRQEAST